jgi:hypothetical protein
MADPSKWDPDPQRQAAFMDEFKNKTSSELAAIHNRLTWLMIPMFFILLVVLGLTLLTWMKVSEIEIQVKGIEKAIDDAHKAKSKPVSTQPLIVLENGLGSDERAVFYHLAEGSEVYPLTWMHALETTNGKLFLDDVERLGFLPDPDNKDGLPVGLTSGVTIGLEPLGPMVGLNCAACHVGELHYQGKRVRVDGAPNLLNTREFFKTLIDAAQSTATDPAKLIAFLGRVKEREEKNAGNDPSKVRVFARKLLVKIAQKEEAALRAVLQPTVEKFIQRELASDPLDLKALLMAGEKDEEKFRARIVKDLNLDGVAGMADKIPLLKDLTDEVEKNSTITRALTDFFMSIRLLRARAEFLKKLGPVGENPRTNWGPGRVDAFGSARTFLFDPNSEPINPVSYPPLFGIGAHDWFHYDNNTTTFLERNFGQALGVGALYAKDDKTGAIYSTLQAQNLVRLEWLANKLSAPQWPVEVFGKIDAERAKRGEKLYTKYCAACHDGSKDNPRFARLYDLDDIKTDPGRATSFAAPLPGDKPFPKAIQDLLFELKTKLIADFPPDEKAKLEKQPVQWVGPAKYAARSLKGSWATPPYLHNGSVPTMDDLLKPAKDRPPTFYLGSHEYDVAKLGYVSDERTTLFDTKTAGNKNDGHEGERYGTTISPDERKDLLEYLKTQ